MYVGLMPTAPQGDTSIASPLASSLLARAPHRPPFRLVDRVIATSATEIVAERRVTHDDPLIGNVLSGSLLVEALAQTAALLATAELGAHAGYLVALRDVVFDGNVSAGDTIRLRATRIGALGALHRVEAAGSVGDRVVVRGQLTFAVEPTS